MVYCGKPSRGCQMCRTRRIKCDETKPTCNQCLKSRRQCPGYKDDFDLVFRNETQATERRARKANRKAMAAKLARVEAESQGSGQAIVTSTSTFSSSSRGSTSPTDVQVLHTLSIPLDQQASCHFVANFVLIPRQNGCSGFLDYIPVLLRDDAPSKPLSHAFNACALASLNNRVNAGKVNLGDMALGEYTKALQSVHIALQDPEASKADSTLAAVLLLGLFENVTAKQLGMLAWGSHIEGAVQMVKSRGRKQLRSKIGLQLFIAVRTQMIIHTISSGTAPIMGVEWWISDAVRNEQAAEVHRLNIRTSELRAEVTRLMTTVARSPENIEIMLDMIKRAQRVDQECVAWMTTTPPHWQWKTVAWEDNVPKGDYTKAEVFPGRVDVYSDFWIASVWNMARVCRIILASVIVRCAAWVCAPVDYRTTPEYATAARTCVDVITDIIASVPYHLGWHLKRKDILGRAETSSFACGDENVQKMLAGYFLSWPLACIYGQDYTTDAQRQWVYGRLKFVGDGVGIKYAHILTQLNVRFPSMMIRRDGLMAQPYPFAHNFVKLVESRFGPPPAGYKLNPLQQREGMRLEQAEKDKADVLAKAGGGDDGNSQSAEWANRMLAV